LLENILNLQNNYFLGKLIDTWCDNTTGYEL